MTQVKNSILGNFVAKLLNFKLFKILYKMPPGYTQKVHMKHK